VAIWLTLYAMKIWLNLYMYKEVEYDNLEKSE
jgi:hypothetical protein